MTVELVCSVCGSANWRDPQPSVDKRWPLARCMDHADKRRAPLISARAFAKRQRPKPAAPDDLLAGLPDDERRALAKPLNIGPADHRPSRRQPALR